MILGIGIVSYAAQPEEDPPVTEMEYDQEYRVDTDVITAVSLYSDQRKSITEARPLLLFALREKVSDDRYCNARRRQSAGVGKMAYSFNTSGYQDYDIINKGTLSTTQMTVRVEI